MKERGKEREQRGGGRKVKFPFFFVVLSFEWGVRMIQ